MKLINLLNRIGASILALSFVFVIGAMSMSAQAQDRNRNRDDRSYEDQRRDRDWNNDNRRRGRRGRSNDGYGNYGGSYQLRQTALNAGFNEGTKEGRQDRSRGDRFDFTDESAYQKGTKDYSSRLGDREIYRRYFRAAFQNGYEEGYGNY